MNTKLSLLLLLSFTCQADESWISLLDRDLSQWDTYLSFEHQVGYDGSPPVDEEGNPIEPIGLNNDQKGVFTTEEVNGQIILRVSGEVYGCVVSKNEYENYHFRLEMKWGELKWNPRKALLKDSGILYHSIGPLGAEYWRSWMLSQEFQIMEGHMGDYWNQATSAIDIRAYPPEYIMNPIASEIQPFLALGHGEENGGFCLRSEDLESPPGEWTTLELYCFGNKSIHVVNGEVVMVLKNSRYYEGEKAIPLAKGKIQLQSEAAEVFFRNIEIRQIAALPERFSAFYKED